jgi:hypothetical protein
LAGIDALTNDLVAPCPAGPADAHCQSIEPDARSSRIHFSEW